MRKPRRTDAANADHHRRALRMLEMGGLVRRRQGWRFGTARIRQDMVDRLVAAGHAIIDGDRCISTAATEARP